MNPKRSSDRAGAVDDGGKARKGVEHIGQLLRGDRQSGGDYKRVFSQENAHDEGEFAKLKPRFEGGSVEEVKAELNKALERFAQTETSRKLEAVLTQRDLKLRDLVERPRAEVQGHSRFTSMLVACAEDAGCSPRATGVFVHRLMELRAMAEHPYEVARGDHLLEQHIYSSEGHKRLDYVIRREHSHFIGDYKPVNLAEFVESQEGAGYKAWLKENFGETYAEHLREGRHFMHLLPPDLKASLRQFMASAVEKHKGQLRAYAHLYAKSANVPLSKVKFGVHPYFVYHPHEAG